ncbi:hypothetical protein AK830_g5531 [Neonectria ditissima]|uniref:N-acetyltransferase domain-containing protein n=1 Tax=Neonectria ditissima TaxID=78410 RepID=A0A0P7BKJ4_9HYPO|nr:hypothetical protein AK830_g5531 [Neonectria ditissima]
MEPTPIEWVTVKTTLPKFPLPPNEHRQPWKTERLTMRPLTDDDIKGLQRLRSQPEVMVRSVQGRPDNTIEETRDSLALRLPPQDVQRYEWAICLTETREMIGLGGNGTRDGEQGWPVMGYSLVKEHWGKGYATEFLKGFLSAWWALPREEIEIKVDKNTVSGNGDVKEECISATTEPDNPASQNVMRKAGLELASVWEERDLRFEDQMITLCGFVARRGKLVH